MMREKSSAYEDAETFECPERIRSVLRFPEDTDRPDRRHDFGIASGGAGGAVAAIGGRRPRIPAHAPRRCEVAGDERTALTDGVVIKIGSAFRSVDRQAEIILDKLAEGLSLAAVFA